MRRAPHANLAMRRHHLALILTTMLAACAAIGPDYQRPNAVVPPTWKVSAPEPAASAAASGADAAFDEQPLAGSAGLVNTAWWSAFGDPQLDALIRTALDENKDLLIAAYRIDRFDAQLQTTRSAGQPQVSAGESSRKPP